MSSNLAVRDQQADKIERVLIGGDLKELSPIERVEYYRMVCNSVGLNPLTKPFEYITLNGRLTLYARKDCTDQLRNVHQVSVNIVAREYTEGCYVVTSRAKLPTGREDESIGAVPIENLKGEARANAMMKCETKSKRRVTLSICGLGILDETEIESIPESRKKEVTVTTEDIEIKRESAAPNSGQGTVSTLQREPVAADTHSTVLTAGESVSSRTDTAGSHEPAAPVSVEYISVPQQRNFHKECRAAVPEHRKMEADNLIYKWLGDHGYRDKDTLPTASMIPAAGWLKVRERAIEWLKQQ